MSTESEILPSSEASNNQSHTRPTGTLLIVDDEDGPRLSLRMVFKEDFKVLLAASGPEAIECVQKHKVDVALVDIRMAGMSGIEVLERLKYVDPGIEVIMMTAFETTDTMRQALRLRASDYLNKPFDVATVRAAVSNALQRRALQGEIHSDAEKLQQLMGELKNQKVLEQISQTRGDIYASILHDINGPLTVISGFVQLLNQRIGDSTRLETEDLEFIKQRLHTITRQVANCIAISRRYLGFLRRQTEDSQRVNVNDLLGDLKHLIQVHPSRARHEFSVRPLPRNMAVRMNGTDIIQVLLNLAVNGFQCSPQPHAVEIEARLLEQPLELASFKDSPTSRMLNIEGFENLAPLVAMSVHDTGPGIPQEVLPKIFEPYFTTKSAQQGTGLGLNIVQRLVRVGKAALHLQTEEGKGTTFTLYVAAAPMDMA